jgi:type II secretory ATPase GspE/PulE/Tfp pilus assembly ATPase PilB-like protein/nucleotide-binding universal stress UspA family protein
MSTIQRILVPTDFSASIQDTLVSAREMAEQYRAELHVLHVVPSPRLPPRPGADAEGHLRDARDRVERLTQPAALGGATIVREVRAGKPWAEIVGYAREKGIDLIVMGTQGRTGVAHLVLGSVAEQVIRHARCPVLVRRPQAGAGAEPTAAVATPDIIDRGRMAEALRLLQAHFDSELAGDRPESWQRMVHLLAHELDLEPPVAGRLLSDLESARALVWHETARPQQDAGTPGAKASPPHWTIGAEVPDLEVVPPGSEVVEAEGEVSPSISIDLLQRALAARATDIHINPTVDDQYGVHFRIDGRLEHYCDLDRNVAIPLLQQLKVLASIDIAEPFRPKEGRLRLPGTLAGTEVRITTAPVHGGTAMALRLLRRDRVMMPLGGLGLSQAGSAAVERLLRTGDGLVLVTGPTGAGKTTTIYSLLNQLGDGGRPRNIVSIEDPIEFPLPFVRQVGVDLRHDLTMTRGLRTILRMDPDIVFVSEIRDVEAAEIVMRAASSGRFVFSTLHTRDVASTVTALRDLHIDSRSMAGNLTGLISQRLVRRLCPHCMARAPLDDEAAQAFVVEGVEPPSELGRPVGCDQCRGIGYRARVGVFETAVVSGPVAEAIQLGAPEDELRAQLRTAGTPSLMADALAKVREGITSLEEARGMKWL